MNQPFCRLVLTAI